MLDKIFGKKTLTYIANAGVMININDTKFIIDGLVENLDDTYITPEEDLYENIVLSKEPYHNIDYIFVTHAHKDHISPAMTNELLRRNKHIRLVCPPEVTKLLKSAANYNDMLAGQIFTVSLKTYSSVPVSFEDCTFTAYRIPHDGVHPSVTEHLAYCIETGGKRIIALGDCSQKKYDFESAGFPARCDVLICPANMTGQKSGREIISSLKPSHVFLCHLKNRSGELTRITELTRRYQKSLPKMTLLTQPAQQEKL